jgi:hypothetical protein
MTDTPKPRTPDLLGLGIGIIAAPVLGQVIAFASDKHHGVLTAALGLFLVALSWWRGR